MTETASGPIVYFGDSMTDGGNLFDITTRILTIPFPLAAFGYSENVTNGRNYADVASALLGAEELNFAIGGARAVGVRTLASAVDPGVSGNFLVEDPDLSLLDLDINLGGQVSRYLATLAQGAAPAPTASIFIGLNDFNNFQPSNPLDPAQTAAEAAALAGSVAAATLGAAAALAQAGVGTIILNTLPLASFFPSFKFAPPLIQALGDQVISGYNDALIAQSAQLSALGVTVKIVDLEAVAAEVAADPSAFGFVTVSEQLFFGTAADPIIIEGPEGPIPFFPSNPAVEGLHPDQFAFYDLFHPTEAMHETFGVFTAESLSSDVSILTDGADRHRGTGADELVLGKAGNDRIDLGGGDDVALGGLGNDKASGGKGSDIVSGGAGNDNLNGNRGDDFVGGGAGNDFVNGGAGNDALADGLGADLLLGGSGNDVFFHKEASLLGGSKSFDLFIGGGGRDTLVLTLTDETAEAMAGKIEAYNGRFAFFRELGLTAIGIEEIVVRKIGDDVSDLGLTGDLADRVEEADLWGFV